MSDSHSEGIQSTPPHGDSHGIQVGHGHGSDHALPPPPFTDAEIAHFRKEDVYAGGAVVGWFGTLQDVSARVQAEAAGCGEGSWALRAGLMASTGWRSRRGI